MPTATANYVTSPECTTVLATTAYMSCPSQRRPCSNWTWMGVAFRGRRPKSLAACPRVSPSPPTGRLSSPSASPTSCSSSLPSEPAIGAPGATRSYWPHTSVVRHQKPNRKKRMIARRPPPSPRLRSLCAQRASVAGIAARLDHRVPHGAEQRSIAASQAATGGGVATSLECRRSTRRITSHPLNHRRRLPRPYHLRLPLLPPRLRPPLRHPLQNGMRRARRPGTVIGTDATECRRGQFGAAGACPTA
mmetsp:Transcript_5129/g.9322  ORF Transcript_5129/g.9322 Transcript_5129/m.9322 type:complete len:248 (-) Transcript_5129:500-1243(-)